MSDPINTNSSSTVGQGLDIRARISTPSKMIQSGHESASAGASRPAGENPQVAITEVAKTATEEKQHSLKALNQSTSDLREAIATLNAALERSTTSAIITRDEDLNRFIVKIADESSGEIVREIPSEALLKFARNLQELKGLIFDKSL
jgi:flagellar protein FlaG